MIKGIIIKPSATPPAYVENPFIGTTTSTYATMPQTIDGTPLSTSAPKRIHQLTRSVPYSDRYTPPITPTGTPMSDANANRVNVPTMALAIPPPTSPTGLGNWVKKR